MTIIDVPLLSVFLLAVAVGSARAREVAGVRLPGTTTAAGKTLILNGAGVRTRFFFKVYVLGLYLERPVTDAAEVLGTDAVRRAELHVLRSLSAEDITSAILTQVVLQTRGGGDRLPTQVLTGLIRAGGDTLAGMRRSIWSARAAARRYPTCALPMRSWKARASTCFRSASKSAARPCMSTTIPACW